MNRRMFLTRIVGFAAAAMVPSKFAGARQAPPSEAEVRVTLDPARTLAVIPPDFTGLGYEISSVARPRLLSAQNAVYVELVRTLGAKGVIRVGGTITRKKGAFSAGRVSY